MNKSINLSNLSPETVLAIEGVPFITKAMALPGVQEASESIFEVPFAARDEEDGEIDVSSELRLEIDTEERQVVMEKWVVAGGLIYDQDAEDPTSSWDGGGKVFHYGRRGGQKENKAFYDALGLDQDCNRDLNTEVVLDELCAEVTPSIRKNRSLMTTLSNLLRGQGQDASWDKVCGVVEQAILQEGAAYARDYVADYFLGVPYWHQLENVWQAKLAPLADLLTESKAEEAWERAKEAGEIGNPLAVMLDVYEHGGVAYSISGEGMNCRWDTSHGGAVWVPDGCAADNIRSAVLRKPEAHGADAATLQKLMAEEAERYCRSCLDTYNAYRNGDVYGVVVYVIDRETGERIEEEDAECWGYYGVTDASEVLEEAMLRKVADLGTTKH